MGWNNIRIMRDRDFEDDELREAYEEGCKEGYKKAMREMRGGYGERRMDDRPYDDDDDDYMGERRGVKNTGPYGGEYRRRRGY